MMYRFSRLSKTFRFLIICILSGLFTPVCVCQAANHLSEIRHWSSPTGTRIVLDLQSAAQYNAFSLQNPDRIVVDLKNVDRRVPQKAISVRDGIVRRIRASGKGRSAVRIVIDLEKKSNHTIFPLKKIGAKPPRLVIDVLRPDLEKADRIRREKTRKQKQKGYYIVVVDPGHGGEDPGAVSRNGTKEKDIVFAVARKTVRQLNRSRGIKAYLTRKGDYFIPLQKRIEIAKQYGADFFISIHADSSFSKKVRGSSVYCLSFKGATSNTARLAAKKENASDCIGGVALDQRNNDLHTIIFDLVQTHSLNASLNLAGLTLDEFAKINRIHTRRPQQANFAVLRAPDIPSILIELDFISNPTMEKRLKNAGVQSSFAQHIARAVHRYVTGAKAPPTAPRIHAPAPAYHTVRKGDTLSEIALRYNTSVSRLRRLNNMSRSSTLPVGRRIRVL